MSQRILFIDDEQNILSGLQRMLRDDYKVTVALGADEAFKKLDPDDPFAVVVCDMRMPRMNGIETLRRFAAESANTTRVMLTGNADQETATRAINDGKIFRFMTKPCSEELLRATLDAAIAQYDLVTAEKVLLEKTLFGSVRVLMDVLSIAQPEAFGRAARARNWVAPLIKALNQRNIGNDALGVKTTWEIQIASLLWPIGLISVPPELVTKAALEPEGLTKSEQDVLARAPETAAKLLGHIPRFQNIAAVLLNQDRGFDGSGFPENGPVGVAIPEGARMLKLLKDLSAAGTGDQPNQAMMEVILKNRPAYDPAILGAAYTLWGRDGKIEESAERRQLQLSISALVPGDRLLGDIKNDAGKLYLSAGIEINAVQIERLRNLGKLQRIVEPIHIERLAASPARRGARPPDPSSPGAPGSAQSAARG